MSGLPTVMSLSPPAGSIHGGTIVTVNGNGFDTSTVVKLGSSFCRIVSMDTTSLTCETTQSLEIPDGEQNKTVALMVRTKDQLHASNLKLNFTYSRTMTPSITSLSSKNGEGGDIIIYGSTFGSTIGTFFLIFLVFFF